MDKYDKHLQFLIAALPDIEAERCREVFLKVAKRDVRKALFFLLQPKEELAVLIGDFALSKEVEQQKKLLNQIFHCYCPNPSYTKIVKQLAKGKPFRIDTATLPKLKQFRRVPSKEVLQQLFGLLHSAEAAVIIDCLKGLKPFGREVERFWTTIDAYANAPNIELAKAALQLLSEMPTGLSKSIMTIAKHCANPSMRFYALSALQRTTNLPSNLLINLLSPIIDEYRRLANTEGAMNDLWEEFRLIQSILKNNGVVLSIPDISLGRF